MSVLPLEVQQFVDHGLQLVLVLLQQPLILLPVSKPHGHQLIDGGQWAGRPLPLPVHQVRNVPVLNPLGVILEGMR